LLAPFFIFSFLFFVLPLCLVIVYSLLAAGPYGGIEWKFDPGAYMRLFYEQDFDGHLVFNPSYLIIFARSLWLAAVCTVLCLAAGFPIAYYMAPRNEKSRDWWILLITIPFWTNLLVRTYAWMLILRNEGLVNTALLDLHIISEPLPLLYNSFAVGIGLLY